MGTWGECLALELWGTLGNLEGDLKGTVGASKGNLRKLGGTSNGNIWELLGNFEEPRMGN